MKTILYLIVFFLLVFNTACIKEECNVPGGTYEFVLPFELSPAQEVFHIGDTITISSTVTNPVYERVTKEYYTLDNFKFYLLTTLIYMDTSITNYQSIDFFDIDIQEKYNYLPFQYSSGQSNFGTQYFYENNKYEIKFRIILKKTGNFLFNQYSEVYFENKNQDFNGKCKNVYVDAKAYTNGRKDNNIQIMSSSKNPFYSEFIIPKKDVHFLDAGGYCFKVVD